MIGEQLEGFFLENKRRGDVKRLEFLLFAQEYSS